jgi:DNA polymerase III sliding clamp (beta) subunit (PCNA family)
MTIKDIASIHAATLHDSLQRAARVAPTKGAAYDKAQGIHLTFKVDHCEVRATDCDVTFWHRVAAEITEPYDDPIELRIPSGMFVAFVASLPMSGDQRVRFRRDDANPRQIIVKYANTKLQAKMNLITGSYPAFGPRDASAMTPAQELAAKLEQVSWAVGDTGVLQGVLIDGKQMVAMDSKRAARIPCDVIVDEPVVGMLKSLTPLIKMGTDIRMMVEENRIFLALDDTCQVTSTVILQPYPNAIERLAALPLTHEFTINRTRLMEAMNRLLIGVRNDRQPRASLRIQNGSLDMRLLSAGAGEIEDSAAITSQVFDDPEGDGIRFIFNPSTLIESLDSFTGANVRIKYGDPRRNPWHLIGDNGYESWVMPIDPSTVAD